MSLRALAQACVALFAVSASFPVAAGVLNVARPPRGLGVADVAIAAVLVGAAATVAIRGRRVVADHHRVAAFRVTQGVLGLIPALLALYFVAGPRVNWPVLVIGLVWRAWLLLSTLPVLAAALALAGPPGRDSGPGRRPPARRRLT